MENVEYIKIEWRNRRVSLSLQQVQQVINGIGSEYTNNEFCTMLDMFVSDNDQKEERDRIATAEKMIQVELQKTTSGAD